MIGDHSGLEQALTSKTDIGSLWSLYLPLSSPLLSQARLYGRLSDQQSQVPCRVYGSIATPVPPHFLEHAIEREDWRLRESEVTARPFADGPGSWRHPSEQTPGVRHSHPARPKKARRRHVIVSGDQDR